MLLIVSRHRGKVLSWLLLFSTLMASFFSVVSQIAYAQEEGDLRAYSEDQSTTLAEMKEEVISILQSPPFVIEEQKRVLEWKDRDLELDENQKFPSWLIAIIRFIETLFGFSGLLDNLALVIEVIIWGMVLLLVCMMIYRFRHHIALYWSSMVKERQTSESFAKPEVIMGMEITEESLPEDVPAEARRLWNDGDFRQALALLYRGSLYELVYTKHFELEEWYTERECNEYVQQSEESSGLRNYFQQLTLAWQNTAYAHRLPEQDMFEQLCTNWTGAFRG